MLLPTPRASKDGPILPCQTRSTSRSAHRAPSGIRAPSSPACLLTEAQRQLPHAARRPCDRLTQAAGASSAHRARGHSPVQALAYSTLWAGGALPSSLWQSPVSRGLPGRRRVLLQEHRVMQSSLLLPSPPYSPVYSSKHCTLCLSIKDLQKPLLIQEINDIPLKPWRPAEIQLNSVRETTQSTALLGVHRADAPERNVRLP